MKRLILSLALLLLPSIVLASAPITRTTPFTNSTTRSRNILAAVALNATASARTITLTKGDGGLRASKLLVGVFYTYSAATTVTAQLSCALDGTNYAIRQTRAISSGTATLSNLTDSKTTGAANHDFMLEFDVRGCEAVKILFGGASADGSDLVNIQATTIVGD